MIAKTSPEFHQKESLHARNLHRLGYDFEALAKSYPELSPFIALNDYQTKSIDFANPKAVKMLNSAILKHFYGIQHWDIPPDYLCPPIPGRADYIHYLADLLADNNDIPTGKKIIGLDIGIGANCVYPIVGHQSYGWSFVGSDIDPKSIKIAKLIIASNAVLSPFVSCRLQESSSDIFKNIIQPNERFDFTICNPPFHASLADAMAGTKRKWKNLDNKNPKQKETRNFGGQHTELWCEGGESVFIGKMIEQSTAFAQQCFWFTTLVSKKTSLPNIYKHLHKVKALDVRTIEMTQGRKISRFVAWTFLDDTQQKVWKQGR